MHVPVFIPSQRAATGPRSFMPSADVSYYEDLPLREASNEIRLIREPLFFLAMTNYLNAYLASNQKAAYISRGSLLLH